MPIQLGSVFQYIGQSFRYGPWSQLSQLRACSFSLDRANAQPGNPPEVVDHRHESRPLATRVSKEELIKKGIDLFNTERVVFKSKIQLETDSSWNSSTQVSWRSGVQRLVAEEKFPLTIMDRAARTTA